MHSARGENLPPKLSRRFNGMDWNGKACEGQKDGLWRFFPPPPSGFLEGMPIAKIQICSALDHFFHSPSFFKSLLTINAFQTLLSTWA